MTSGARIRLFCALRLTDATLDGIVDWQALALPGGRVVPRENLHVTLAFLGGRPPDEVPGIAHELRAAAGGAGRIRLRAVRYRETRSVGMVVLEDVTGAGAALAADLGGRLEALGVYRPEARPWLPHVTVLRFRERPRVQPELPALGEFAPSDAAVYVSQLRPGGAHYEALETARLETTEPGGR